MRVNLAVTRPAILAAALLAACSDGPGGGPGGTDGGPGGSDGGYDGPPDELEIATGCAGVYNPNQLLEFRLEMSPGDWSTVQNDCSFETYVPAMLACGDGPAIQVGVRHKRSGGTAKPGLKIDFNLYAAGQSFYGLKKMSWENGVGSSQDGCGADGGEAGGLISEYLAWRLHAVSGGVTGKAALIPVFVNGDPLGVYVNVEQIDKSFLKRRVGNDSGWLWKYSGSDRDGQQTNEGTEDPFLADLCYLERNGGCPMPSAGQLAAELPGKLDIPQALTVGAVNALMANTDSPLLKFNNYAFYNWTGPRMYFPWDLDTTMKSDYDVFTGSVSGGTTVFTDVLFSNWEDDYADILAELLEGPLSLAAIQAELDRAVDVAGGAMDADPHLGGGARGAADSLADWWSARHAAVSAQVESH
jgi:hypothetical protein